ncbi:MAG: hypothetical protein QNJ51_16590 [Calothrix sp. MO_167.B12]|nr:hypothetical protein [Calothrix sp. MO_167.B12]
MSDIPLCSIAISSTLPPDEIESLQTSLQITKVKLQKSTDRVLGVDDIVVIVSGVAATAQLIDYGIKVGQAIANWRRRLREKGIEPAGKLTHPKRPPLDLSTATDEEIQAWLSQE